MFFSICSIRMRQVLNQASAGGRTVARVNSDAERSNERQKVLTSSWGVLRESGAIRK